MDRLATTSSQYTSNAISQFFSSVSLNTDFVHVLSYWPALVLFVMGLAMITFLVNRI